MHPDVARLLDARRLVSRKLVGFRLNPTDLGEDRVGISGPGEGFAVGIPVGDVVLDHGDEQFG
jgi:hypothetical protein